MSLRKKLWVSSGPLILLIPGISVVKNDRHKPKDIFGEKVHVDYHAKRILLHSSSRFFICRRLSQNLMKYGFLDRTSSSTSRVTLDTILRDKNCGFYYIKAYYYK